MGGIGAVAEPLVVIFLLFGGTYLNRTSSTGRKHSLDLRRVSADSSHRLQDVEGRPVSPSVHNNQEPKWRERTVGFGGWRKKVVTPNTRQFRDYFLSRLLEKFPFLVECWYWALIYWVSRVLLAFDQNLFADRSFRRPSHRRLNPCRQHVGKRLRTHSILGAWGKCSVCFRAGKERHGLYVPKGGSYKLVMMLDKPTICHSKHTIAKSVKGDLSLSTSGVPTAIVVPSAIPMTFSALWPTSQDAPDVLENISHRRIDIYMESSDDDS